MKKKIKVKGPLRIYLQWPIWLTVLLLAMTIWIFTINIKCGIIVSVFLVFYFGISLTLYLKNRQNVMNELISFATEYAQVQRQLLYELEVPYALLDDQGRILWVNERFRHILDKEKLQRKMVNHFFPDVKKSWFQSEEEDLELETTYEEKDYRIVLHKTTLEEIVDEHPLVEYPEGGVYLTSMYLFDETQIKYYMKENQDQKLISGLIYIDNYDEALESVENVRRSLLIALIDRKINKYISDVDGIVRKLEKDKYFIVFQYRYLKNMQENRFSLLDEVKNVNIGNEMAVTLSVGLGVNGENYTEACEYARIAMDLALGRGGDQAVIKDGENIYYYGGKAKQVEKNTRVKARVKAHALREILENNDKVIIMGHKIGDVDSFGSGIGIYRAAKSMAKRCYIVVNEITSSVRPLLDGFNPGNGYEEDLFLNSSKAIEKVDDNTVVIVVDVNRPSYTECEELLQIAKNIVVIDHHRQSSEVIDNAVLSYVEPYASSASEMVAEILQYIGDNIKIKQLEADALYAGMVIDTNNFVNKTGVRTFEAAAFLRRNGADIIRVRKMFRDNMEDYRAKAETIHNMELFEDIFAISVSPTDGIESPTIVAAQAANDLLNISGIKASFVLTEYNSKVYISARSIDEINVQLIMEQMGGGGHASTAGAQLKNCSLDNAKEQLKTTIKRMRTEGDI